MVASNEDDLWQVKLSEGCVLEMTLDEIDTAFNAGRISGRTPVLAPGDFRWTTLGEAAGLDDDEAGAVEEAAPCSESVPYSIAPVAADVAPPSLSSFALGTPTPPPVGVDVDFDTSPDASVAGLPSRRRRSAFGKVFAVGAVFSVLIAAGVAGGAYAARPTEFKEKIAELRDRVAHTPSKAEVVVAAPPPAREEARDEVPAPAPAPVPEPAAENEAAPAPSTPATTSVDSLPDADSKAGSKADAKHGGKKSKSKKRRSHKSSKRHQAGAKGDTSGERFDPMNGSL